jgi:L-glyceraldehyde 3-phosphate reductase
MTPENIAAAERLAAWTAGRGIPSLAPVALAWVLRRREVSSAIIGATSVEQLEQNLEAEKVELSEADWREVEAAIAGPKVNGRAAGEAGANGKRAETKRRGAAAAKGKRTARRRPARATR